MPLADNWAKVSSILTQQAARDESRRKRESEQSIQDLYSSGQPVDQGSIQRLLASGADPASVASIAKIMRGQTVDTARVANLQSQMKVRESPMVAGAIKKAFDTWNSKPPEEQTQSEWEKWKATGRSHLASNGLDPELIPADADPAFIDMQIGAGYSPGAQDLTMDRRSENVARQGRFETSQAGMDARSSATIAGADRRSALNRAAVTERERDKGTPGTPGTPTPKPKKVTQFDQDLADAGYEPGSPQYIKAKNIKLGLERGAGTGTGGGQGGQRQIANVQNKLQTIALLKQQLLNVKNSFTPLKGSYSAGPGADYLPTEAGQSFDAAVAAISPIVRQLTRTPGEGAMSDYESKLAEAVLPSRGKYESVTAQQIQQVEDMVTQLESGYAGMLQDAGAQQSAPAPAAAAPPPGRALPPPGPAAPASGGMDPERAELERLRAMKAAAMGGR